jgi:hypothetical protein
VRHFLRHQFLAVHDCSPPMTCASYLILGV